MKSTLVDIMESSIKIYRRTNIEGAKQIMKNEGRRLTATMWSELLKELSIPEVALFNMYVLVGSRQNGNVSNSNMANLLNLSESSVRRLRSGLEKKGLLLIRETKGKDAVKYTTVFLGKEVVAKELKRVEKIEPTIKEVE